MMVFAIILASCVGIAAHLFVFKHGEWHQSTGSVVACHLTALLLLFSFYNHHSDSIWQTSITTTAVFFSYLVPLFTSISIYRVFFHPLSHFPGPRWAAVTKFWHVFRTRSSTNYLLLDEVHQTYGRFVRTGPNEITIFHPGAIEQLDGPNNDTTKDEFYDVLRPRVSAVFTRDRNEHKQLRHAWNQSLSTKSMDVYRPRIAELAASLEHCVSTFKGSTINMNDVMTWFSFDAMGEVVFGEDFGLIRDQAIPPALAHQGPALAFLGPIIDTMWIVDLAFTFVPFLGLVRDWMKMVTWCEEHMDRRSLRKDGKMDLATFFLRENEALKTSKSDTYRQSLLHGSAIVAVVAGSDTTRAALIGIWWYLCTYPEHIKKIQKELESVDFMDANQLARLMHLNSVINEVLRLLPPVLTGNGRFTGSQGLTLDGVWIPPHTKVTAPKYTIQRMECAFERPDEFIPERWYPGSELIRDRQAFFPFSTGARGCIGKVLAYAELRLVVAVLLHHFNVKFAAGYDTEMMWRDMKDQVTAHPGEVHCEFERRAHH